MKKEMALRANAPEMHNEDAGQPPSLSVSEVSARAPVVAQEPSDPFDNLEKLVNWLQAGLLTKEEFEKAALKLQAAELVVKKKVGRGLSRARASFDKARANAPQPAPVLPASRAGGHLR